MIVDNGEQEIDTRYYLLHDSFPSAKGQMDDHVQEG